MLRSVCKPNENVDIAITFRASSVNDLLEHYFVKRAAQLCTIAKFLKSFKMFENCTIVPFRGDCNKPVLQITPCKDAVLAPKFAKTNFKINVHIALDPVLVPKVLQSSVAASSSPYYLHTILEDAYYFQHLQHLHALMKDCPSLVESVTLYKVWARQRDILLRGDSVNGFLFSMILLYLLNKKLINKHLSPFLILKIAFNWIATTQDFKCEFLEQETGLDAATTSQVVSHMSSNFDLALIDASTRFNLFHRVSINAWKELKIEAQRAIQFFEDERKGEAIEALFLQKHCYWHNFDAYLKISNVQSLLRADSQDKKFAGMSLLPLLHRRIERVLEQALADRLRYLRILPISNGSSLIIGMIFNQNWSSPLVRGPNPLDKDAKEAYESFWGNEKAHLRKFKDGSLAICTYWDNGTKHKVDIVEQICTYVLSRHVATQKQPEILCEIIGKSFFSFLHLPEAHFASVHSVIDNAFASLKGKIMAADLNLLVEGVYPAYSEVSKTAIFPALQNPLLEGGKNSSSENLTGAIQASKGRVQPLLVVVEFQGDTRWPDGIEAIAKLKELMYMRLSFQLRLKNVLHKQWIDVIIQGIAFRVIIRLHKELQILKSTGHALDPKTLAMERELFQAPRHQQFLSSFTGAFAAFSGTVRLAKRWVHAHLFSDFICDELIEVLVAHLFSTPYPYDAPTSEITGFARFINLVANHDWSNVPLLVNMALEKSQKIEEEQEFEQIKEEYEQMPTKPHLYVCASYNKDLRSYWTRLKPSKMIWSRIVATAKSAEAQLQTLFSVEYVNNGAKGAFDWLSLFRTSIEYYDVKLSISQEVQRNIEASIEKVASDLQKDKLGVYQAGKIAMKHDQHSQKLVQTLLKQTIKLSNSEGLSKKEKNDKRNARYRNYVIGFEPVQHLLAMLNERFGKFALFFYDKHVEDAIYIIWNPIAFLPTKFNPQKATATMPLLEGSLAGKIVPNMFEIVADIATLGKGIIEKIQFNCASEKIQQ